jgi:hypothetical protein
MTENELTLDEMLECLSEYADHESAKQLIKLLEELKRWRTDKIAPNIKNPFAYTSTLICHNCDHKDDYIEELEAEVAEYREIGTPEECRKAVDKQTAKKPYLQPVQKNECREDECWECPSCDSFLGYEVDCRDDHYRENYCPCCGQKLDWEDEE